MKPEYILRLTYQGGSVWFRGQTTTLRKYPGVKAFKTVQGAQKAVERLNVGKWIIKAEILEVSFERMAVYPPEEKQEFPNGEFDNGKHWRGEG